MIIDISNFFIFLAAVSIPVTYIFIVRHWVENPLAYQEKQ